MLAVLIGVCVKVDAVGALSKSPKAFELEWSVLQE